MLWLVFALLTGLAVFSLLWPLSRTPAPVTARDRAKLFYREQVAEIGRDKARGLIGEVDATVAEAEAGRRLLQLAERPAVAAQGSTRNARVAAGLCLALIPAVALGVYLSVGSPDDPDQPLAARLTADPAHLDVAAAVAKVEAHLAADPNDARGYEILAPVYLRQGRMTEAVHARREVLRLRGDSAQREVDLGEALVMGAGGRIDAEARGAFERALSLEPAMPAARFYAGLTAEQDGDSAKARTLWTALVADAPPEAPFVPTVRARIAALDAPQSPAAAGIAAMPAAERNVAIRGMVDGLAQRLAANGSDPEGWLRLVRAYKVLGEADKSRDALRDARRNLANDSVALARLSTLARELGLEEG